jgi:hypothetical protein
LMRRVWWSWVLRIHSSLASSSLHSFFGFLVVVSLCVFNSERSKL